MRFHSIVAETDEPLHTSSRCPSKPNPVTSVSAWTSFNSERTPRRVEHGCAVDHRAIARRIECILFQRRAVDAHTERLAEDQFVTRLRVRVALHVLRMHHPDGNQTVDRLDRI